MLKGLVAFMRVVDFVDQLLENAGSLLLFFQKRELALRQADAQQLRPHIIFELL